MNKSTTHYVNDASLYEAIKKWQALEKENPNILLSDEIGEGIMAIATNLTRRWNFAGYTPEWKEQMIGDAIVACVRSIKNFNTELYCKPHSYLTTVAFSAFQERIKKEKKNNATKYKYFINEVFDHTDEEMSAMVDPIFYQDMVNKIHEYEVAKIKKPAAEIVKDVEVSEEEIPLRGLGVIYGNDF